MTTCSISAPRSPLGAIIQFIRSDTDKEIVVKTASMIGTVSAVASC